MKRSLLILTILVACSPLHREGIRRMSPARAGMDAQRLALIDSTAEAAIAAGDVPGAVIGVVREDALVYEKAFGNKALVPEIAPMTTETLFDLASVSKCVSTTIAIMQLVEKGQLRLVDPVARYIPEFKPWEDPNTHEQVQITIQDLLTHSSGLVPSLPNVPGFVQEHGENCPDALMNWIATEAGRNFRPRTRQLYSCLNFITLQYILEQVTGERLCDYAQKHIFDVLGLRHTTYFPLYEGASDRASLSSLCAPTEQLPDGHVLQAEVHDPTARLVNGGNSGNAGVFSTVEDLAILSACLLNEGSWNGHRILSPLTVRQMFRIPETNAPEVARALGWDTYSLSPYTCGDIFNPASVRGHTGYTGTSLILDLETRTAVIILTNRVHPADSGSATRLRSTVASIVASAITD